MNKLLLPACLILISGCVPPSMNLQRATLRAVGDASITAIVDNRSDEKVDETLSKVKEVGEGIAKFLKDGKVADLTDTQLKEEILKLVPAQYKNWADQLLGVVSVREVNVGKIGADNVALLDAFVKGTLTGVVEYNKKHRPVKEEPKPAETPAVPPSP